MFSLKSKVTRKILNYLFLHEDERFYVNELAKLIKEDPANVHKKLEELKEEGILSDQFRGRERYFFLNKRYPFLKEYKNIVLKGLGFERIIKRELGKVEGVKSAYIFGSYARGELFLESDIDLLVIGDFDTLKLQKVLLKVQDSVGREINSIELTKEEFEERKKEKDPFLKDIFSKEYIKIL